MDDRKARTVVYWLWGCLVRDAPAMEERVSDTFGHQLEHCFGIAVGGCSEMEDLVGVERRTLRKEIKDLMLGPGGEATISVRDGDQRCIWIIGVMVKDGGFLKTDEGLDAVINFGQVFCQHVELFIPPADDSVSFDAWIKDTLWWDGFVEAEFGDGTAFNISDTDTED